MSKSSAKKWAKRVAVTGLLLAAISWTADWAIFRSRGQPYGEVEVHRRFADHLKNKRIEYRFEEPQMETCVHSIYPHDGETACWYLERHTEQLFELDGSPWHFWNP